MDLSGVRRKIPSHTEFWNDLSLTSDRPLKSDVEAVFVPHIASAASEWNELDWKQTGIQSP